MHIFGCTFDANMAIRKDIMTYATLQRLHSRYTGCLSSLNSRPGLFRIYAQCLGRFIHTPHFSHFWPHRYDRRGDFSENFSQKTNSKNSTPFQTIVLAKSFGRFRKTLYNLFHRPPANQVKASVLTAHHQQLRCTRSHTLQLSKFIHLFTHTI